MAEVKLPEYTPTPEPQVEVIAKPHVGFSDLSAKREAYSWPESFKGRFDDDLLDWYIVDIVLTKQEKIDHLLNLDWSLPPFYARSLITKTSAGKFLYILGSNEIYNQEKKKITPIGEEEDAYRAWLKNAKDRFIDKRREFFASVKDGGIIFNMDEKANEIKRAERSKNIGGRQCTTYTAGLLNKFSEWLVGSGFPERVKTKSDRCMFLELLVREAVRSGKHGIFWVTPEEYSIFSEDDNRSGLLKRLKD
jgi:hypothetical protein